MNKKRKIINGTLLGAALTGLALACVFGLGLLLGPVVLNEVRAATPGQSTTNGSQPVNTTPLHPSSSAGHKDQQYYMDLLEQNLATRFGVDKAKLDSSFAAAVSDTVDQAVQNGDLSQDQATQLKGAADTGVGKFMSVVAGGGIPGSQQTVKTPDPRTDELLNAAFSAAATQLGMASKDDLQSALKQGAQSLAQLAQAHNITPQALQDTMLHAAKADADSNVASSKWTQAQADESYNNVTNMIAKMMSTNAGRDAGPVDDLVPAGFHAGGQFIGLSNPDDFGLLIKRDNKSLAQIAQEHNVSLDGLKNAMLQAARALADQNVASGKWTQAQADAGFNGFSNLVQTLSNGSLTPETTPTPGTK
jgi:lambda repressor-like predicted transcriptional regulator